MFPAESTGGGFGGEEMVTADNYNVSPASVGRLVDCSQADDRRVIRLVRERRLLYARNQLPVANYYSRVKALWEEVADEMGWSVAEVRRKWSHIRNSYSRHLRNEVCGALTGRGRHVSRWYLADELDFLREHMATDTRRVGSFGSGSGSEVSAVGWCVAGAGGDDDDSKSSGRPPYWTEVVISPLVKMEAPDSPQPAPTPPAPTSTPAPIAWSTATDESSSSAFGSHETDSYFNFFRGIHDDYQALTEHKQRLFRRQCLELLHHLLDEQHDDQQSAPVPVAVLPN